MEIMKAITIHVLVGFILTLLGNQLLLVMSNVGIEGE